MRQLQYWLEEDRGQCYFIGLEVRTGRGGRGLRLRLGEKARHVSELGGVLPDVEMRRAAGPSRSDSEELEETIARKKIGARRGGKPFSPERHLGDEVRDRECRHSSRHDAGSAPDWIRRKKRDQEFVRDRQGRKKTRVHALSPVTKSWGARGRRDPPMYEEDRLSDRYDLRGDKAPEKIHSGMMHPVAVTAPSRGSG